MTEAKYSTHTYDLSIERIDAPINLSGGSISVLAVKGDCFIKINDKSQDPINLLHTANIKTEFTKFYLSNNVQVGGYVTIVIGKHCEFELTTNIAQATHEPLLLPPQNIPLHLRDRAICEPEVINVWNIENATLRHSFSISPQTTNYRGLFFKPNGSKMYVVGFYYVPTVGYHGEIYEYDLSIPWNIHTAIFRHLKDITAQTDNPTEIFFNPTGTLMYIIENSFNRLLKYTLSRNWDITSATLTTSITAPFSFPSCIYINSSGYKMYLLDTTNNLVNEYDLNIAWDITTHTLRHSFNVSSQTTRSISIFFSYDGLKVYIIDDIQSKIIEYKLLKAWNITSSVFKQSFNLTEILITPRGLFINLEGKKMYIGSRNTNNIYEFDL